MAELSQKTGELSDEFFILGLTSNGKQFRPSDWAERLCGVMSCFNPEGGGRNAHLQYSPYVRPTVVNGVKVYDFGLATEFWVGAAVVSTLLALLVWNAKPKED